MWQDDLERGGGGKHTTLGNVGVEVDVGEIGGRYEDKIICIYKILQLKIY